MFLIKLNINLVKLVFKKFVLISNTMTKTQIFKYDNYDLKDINKNMIF